MSALDEIRNIRDNFDKGEGDGHIIYHRSYEEAEINFVRIEPGEGLPFPLNEEQEGRYYQAVIHGKLNGEERYFTTSLFGSGPEAAGAAVGLVGNYGDDIEIDSVDIQVIDTGFDFEW